MCRFFLSVYGFDSLSALTSAAVAVALAAAEAVTVVAGSVAMIWVSIDVAVEPVQYCLTCVRMVTFKSWVCAMFEYPLLSTSLRR